MFLRVEVEEEGQIDIFVNDLSEPADGSRQSASPIQYFEVASFQIICLSFHFEGSPPKKRKKSPSPIQYFEVTISIIKSLVQIFSPIFRRLSYQLQVLYFICDDFIF